MSATLDIDAVQLANWLESQGPGRLWNVEGEDLLEEAIALPTNSEQLATELRRREGRLRVHAPAGKTIDETADLTSFAYGQGDEIIFRLSWLDQGESASQWFLLTDTVAERETRAAHAS